MITILLFASLKERVGQERIQWEKGPIKVSELRAALKRVPGLDAVDQVMIAVNEAYALDDQMINEGDTVALIPPVSGG
ncbi:molybdopterin converting factor subunit 1 [Pullulanibacillus sp. KACC 23026]|uniref:molybdopterin converting factor subunit 1 n=1 Tax=Pullulanibacillus sp. KACC 23026 TaxID=3028315 RepID=UPI0023B1F0B2|nr:molybdopterin converting factor subunit 1 [Pullulanibacillus sp. KACC 23026]WEG11935.1 molybdopterin converting factor subunit 1 [Pullulanibacillus sp. KACC 23026]